MREKLRTVITRLSELSAKASLSDAENTELEGLIVEGESIKAQIARQGRADELRTWAHESAGVIDLAPNTGATVIGMRQSGQTEVVNQGASLLVNSEGEGLVDAKTLASIGSPEYRAAFRSYIRGGRESLSVSALRVLSEGTDTAGGFLVPADVLARLIAKKPAPTNVAGQVTVLPTSRDSLVMPRVNYTTNDIYTTGMRVTWTGEVPSSSTVHRVTDPVWGQLRIPVYTAMMSMPLTNDLIEDAAFPVVSWSEGKFSETRDLLYDDMVLNGSGVGQPRGILLNPNATDEPAQVVSGSASLLTADGLQDLAWALPEQYDVNARFVFNKTNTGKAIAKLKDGDGRYLWGSLDAHSGLTAPVAQKPLLGYPALFNALMPNVGANTFPIIFGDLSGYYLAQRVAFSIQVLRERYAEDNQIVLLGRLRFGGAVAEAWKMKIQKVSA